MLFSATTGSRRDLSRLFWSGNSSGEDFCQNTRHLPARVGSSSLTHVCSWLFSLEKQQHQRRCRQQPNRGLFPAVTFQEPITKISISHPARCCAGFHRGQGVCWGGEGTASPLFSLHWHQRPEKSPAPRGVPQPGKKNELYCSFLPQNSLSWPQKGAGMMPAKSYIVKQYVSSRPRLSE